MSDRALKKREYKTPRGMIKEASRIFNDNLDLRLERDSLRYINNELLNELTNLKLNSA